MVPVRDYLPRRSVASVNYALIVVNVVVFALEVTGIIPVGNGGTTIPGALIPAQLLADPAHNFYTLVTHMFLHGSVSHVAGNMLFLWIFGDNVEDALGHGRYILFYLVCGLVAAGVQIAVTPHSSVPMIGASGAISGVLAGYVVLYPRASIAVLNPIPIMWLFWGLIIWLPAWLVIIEWFALNVWYALHPSSDGGGVAFVAHVGGFLAGLALMPFLRTEDAVGHDNWDRLLPDRRRLARG
jgi:membrane associated rhomboid family serine protease